MRTKLMEFVFQRRRVSADPLYHGNRPNLREFCRFNYQIQLTDTAALDHGALHDYDNLALSNQGVIQA